MSLLEQLSRNKGTVSTALGKALAQKVLAEGQTRLLLECVDLASYQAPAASAKQIRAGAAKVVELVSEKRPDLVAPYLKKLLPALAVPEPQTRWMIIRVMGSCAKLNRPIAQQALASAEKYVDTKEGVCLAAATDLFLGDLGAISKKDAQRAFPLLQLAMETPIPNEPGWLLEAGFKMYANLGETEREQVVQFAERYQSAPQKSTQQRARKILRLE
jgi:hypothetical protein